MKRLEGYSEYPFKGVEVGRTLFAQFVKIFIERLIAAANPVYAAIIGELQAAFSVMFGDITKHHQNMNLQISETLAVKEIIQRFRELIDDFESAVKLKFKKKSKEYLECFPHGITEYKRAALHDILIMMNQAEFLADKYKNDLGPTFLADFNDQRIKFESERDLQLETIGSVKGIIPDYEIQQENMIKLLYKGMLIILLENVDHPKVMLSFFDEQLIWPKHPSGEEDGGTQPYSIIIPKNSRKVADISFSVDDKFLITLISGNSISFYPAVKPDDPPPPVPTELPEDDGVEVTGILLGAPDMKYIIFINNDPAEDGEVEVTLI